MDACYIARRNVITGPDIRRLENCIKEFHNLRTIFTDAGVRTSISLPRQHALTHYPSSIINFGAPNGLCSSITESRHVKAVKKTWRRSSRFKALYQMLQTILRLEKMAALRLLFDHAGLTKGSATSHTIETLGEQPHPGDPAMNVFEFLPFHSMIDEDDDFPPALGGFDEADGNGLESREIQEEEGDAVVAEAVHDESLFEVRLSGRARKLPDILSFRLFNVTQSPATPKRSMISQSISTSQPFRVLCAAFYTISNTLKPTTYQILMNAPRSAAGFLSTIRQPAPSMHPVICVVLMVLVVRSSDRAHRTEELLVMTRCLLWLMSRPVVSKGWRLPVPFSSSRFGIRTRYLNAHWSIGSFGMSMITTRGCGLPVWKRRSKALSLDQHVRLLTCDRLLAVLTYCLCTVEKPLWNTLTTTNLLIASALSS